MPKLPQVYVESVMIAAWCRCVGRVFVAVAFIVVFNTLSALLSC